MSETEAKCSEANPFIFQKGNFKCYVFIKNISPAYYPNYPDNSRVQLPTSDRFKEVIESVRPFLQQDGGDVQFIKFEDGIVFVTMSGACAGCAAIDATLYDGIETILMDKVPEVKGIERV